MRKILFLMSTVLLAIFVLTACSNDKDSLLDENNKEKVEKETETNSDDSNEESTDEETSDSDSSGSGMFEVTEDPQMDLGVGDTGLVQTSIGTYELTLDSAEIMGTELDGEESLLDELIVLDLTFKNLDDKPIIAEDLMYNLGVTTELEGSSRSNNAKFFESIEVFEGEIKPGEERKAQFIADVKTAEEYYFKPNSGAVAAGTHNEILWTIPDGEARK